MPATINATMTLLLHELAEEIPDALTAEFSLACLWHDLCRIAGEVPPPRRGRRARRPARPRAGGPGPAPRVVRHPDRRRDEHGDHGAGPAPAHRARVVAGRRHRS